MTTNNSFEKAYTSMEMSDLLDIGKSTLRKWCLALEENGYQFTKNEHDRRLFLDQDIVALKHFKKLIKTGNMPLKNASDVIISKFHNEAFSPGTPSVLDKNVEQQRSPERSSEVIDQLMTKLQEQDEFIKEQREFNRDLMNRLEKYEKTLDQRLQERDDRLMETLNQLQETKRLKQSQEAESEKKKGFFARLFNK